MKTQTFSTYLILGFILLFSHNSRAAAEELQAPQRIIDDTSKILLAKLKEPGFIDNKAEIRMFVDKAIFPYVDTVRMSALVLGKHWRKASKEQKKRFIAAFKSLLVNTYSATFTEQFNDWTIQYLPLKLKPSDKTTVVKTIVSQTGKADAKIDYSMVLRNEQWKIKDLKVEGISLVIGNRDVFNQMIRQYGSLEAVIVELEAKNS
ncbi:MAG: ABC transporter substrate-binding protein [Methyloprofundus sp.]|nr:ABC transporter substrate-binding protein [Methyloprofundus sp.]